MDILKILTLGQGKGNYEVKKLSYLFFQNTATVSKVNVVRKKIILVALLLSIFISKMSTRNINPFPAESQKREFIMNGEPTVGVCIMYERSHLSITIDKIYYSAAPVTEWLRAMIYHYRT